MRVSFEAPDEWAVLLDEQAQKDGHSNRAAVIRKVMNLFFDGKLAFCSQNKTGKASNEYTSSDQPKEALS
mgnify:CR=1 FL=1